MTHDPQNTDPSPIIDWNVAQNGVKDIYFSFREQICSMIMCLSTSYFAHISAWVLHGQTFREFGFSSEISTCWTQQSNIFPYTCFMFIDQWLCTLSFLEPRWQFSDCFLCPKKPVLRVKCIPSWTSIIQFNITRIYGEWWLHASVLTIYPSARVSPWESTTFVSTKSHNHLL